MAALSEWVISKNLKQAETLRRNTFRFCRRIPTSLRRSIKRSANIITLFSCAGKGNEDMAAITAQEDPDSESEADQRISPAGSDPDKERGMEQSEKDFAKRRQRLIRQIRLL